MSDEPATARPDAARLQAPVARLLRPLVRLFILSGLTFPALMDLLREIYVNVAEYDFGLPSKEQTDSRVSLLTGIHRKEVRRLRGAGAPISDVPAAISRTSLIMARWLASPDFTDAEGKPLPLPRLSDGPGPSFESLVASVTRDVRPRAVLDEWLDRRLVTTDAQDRVVLAEAGFMPDRGSDQQLYYFGRNLHDHISASVSNVVGEGPRFLERAVHYDGLSPDVARQLEKRAREIAMEALQQANREAHEVADTDGGGDWRWNFGIYIYAEEEKPKDTAETPDPPPNAEPTDTKS